MPYILIMNKYHSAVKYLTYLYLISVSTLCSQSIGHISGIVFSGDTKVALIGSFTLHWVSTILGNVIVPIAELPLTAQYLSYASHIKHTFECIMIMIYGWDRCTTSGQHSSVLRRFSIDDHSYWPNVTYLLIVFLGLRLTALLALILKSNTNWRKMFALNYTNTSDKCDKDFKEIVLNDMNDNIDRKCNNAAMVDLW